MKSQDPQALLSLKEFPPLILITGGNGYDREALLKKLDVGKGVLADSLSPQTLSAELTSPTLFSPHKALLIRHLNKLDAQTLKILVTYAEDPAPSLTLICEGESASAPLARAFEAGGIHLDLGRLPPWEEEKAVARWLCQEGQRRLSPQLAQLMVERVGCDKRVLKGELDKLLTFLGDRPSLTKADLDALLVGNVEGSVWELGRAIMGREPSRALHILTSMGDRLGLFGTLAALRSQLQTHLIAASLPPAEVAKALPKLKGRGLERTCALAKQYGEARLRQGLLKLGKLEGQAKREALSEQLALELAVTILADESAFPGERGSQRPQLKGEAHICGPRPRGKCYPCE